MQNFEEAVELATEGPDRAGALHYLALCFGDRYQALKDPQDLDMALQYDLEAVNLTPEDDPDRLIRVANLAISYMDQFERLGNLQDLEAALQYRQEAVNLNPVDHLHRLAGTLIVRYWTLGNPEDLRKALECDFEEGKNYPDVTVHLQKCAETFIENFEASGNPLQLEAALRYRREVVNLTPEDHPEKAERMAIHYQILGNLDHIGKAVDLTATNHRAILLQHIAEYFTDLYKAEGYTTLPLESLPDIQKALKYNQEAINLTPKDHPERAKRLQNLAVSFYDRFQCEHERNYQDLEKALQHEEAALHLTAKDHPDRAEQLLRIISVHSEWYQVSKTPRDLDTLLEYKQEAVNLTARKHPDRAEQLESLASSFAERYERQENLEDLDAELRHRQDVVNLTPMNDSQRNFRLKMLAYSLSTRYDRLGNPKDFEEALRHQQNVLSLQEHNYYRADQLHVIASLLSKRYHRLGNLQDLQASLQYLQEAEDIMPPNGGWCKQHQFSAQNLIDRYRKLGNLQDLEKALEHDQDATKTSGGVGSVDRRMAALSELYEASGDLRVLDAVLLYKQAALSSTRSESMSAVWIPELQSLALSFVERYRKLGNLQDLEKALELDQEAVKNHADGAEQLQNRGLALSDHYKSTENKCDLEAALRYYQKAVNLTPKGSLVRVGRLKNLATWLEVRYQSLGNPQDHKMALNYEKEANLQSKRNEKKVAQWQHLAVSFTDRYRTTKNLQDLEAALQNNQKAVDLTPEDHPSRAERLQSLILSFTEWYQKLGNIQNLNAVLQYKQEAVNLISEEHPERAEQLQSLATSFIDRYRKLGNAQDLEKALDFDQQAVKYQPAKTEKLQARGLALDEQFKESGNLRDLQAALQYKQEVVNLTPDNHTNKAVQLQNLAVSFNYLYQRLGNLLDLDKALQYGQKAVNLTPNNHPDRSERLHVLAMSFSAQYQRLGNLQDHERSLHYQLAALNLTPDDDLNRAKRLQSLAESLTNQYQRLESPSDLEKALKYGQEALNHTAKDHPERARQLHNFAVSLNSRYQRLKSLQDLQEALKHAQEAVSLTVKGHPDRAKHLHNLAIIFRSRYQSQGDLQDLEKALENDQEAVNLTAGNHPHRPGLQQSLAKSFADRYRRLKRPKDLKQVHNHYIASLNLTSSNPEVSWQSALKWASFAAEFQPADCVVAYRAAFRLLPELLWIGYSIPVRQEAICRLDLTGTASTAFRTCLKFGISLPSITEILEQSWGTIFQQFLQLTEFTSHEQIQEFEELSMKLYGGAPSGSIQTVNQWNALIKAIREQQGNGTFLLPKRYEALRRAADKGPVVILTSHKESCDGLIIVNAFLDSPVHVAFPNVTLTLLNFYRGQLGKLCGYRVRGKPESTRLDGFQEGLSSPSAAFAKMLTWLWANIVEPVYKTLESHNIYCGRLWWLPTEGFTGLPLHACSPNDLFIHSYTPALSTLLRGNNDGQRTPRRIDKFCVIGVTQTDSAGANPLSGVGEEVKNILSIVPEPNITCFEGEQATVDAIESQLQDCKWLHLACHGKQDLKEPIKSHLLLYEGSLSLEKILQTPLMNAEVVYLAACQTAMGDTELANEAFHLGGGFIAGTLWAMDDQDGPLVAKAFYSHLLRNGRWPLADVMMQLKLYIWQ